MPVRGGNSYSKKVFPKEASTHVHLALGVPLGLSCRLINSPEVVRWLLVGSIFARDMTLAFVLRYLLVAQNDRVKLGADGSVLITMRLLQAGLATGIFGLQN